MRGKRYKYERIMNFVVLIGNHNFFIIMRRIKTKITIDDKFRTIHGNLNANLQKKKEKKNMHRKI